ncbi:MAG: electron transport complex subunit RsxA [Bacilli bacterium]|nr:electron transport complex subunit RsxA [Bacilli bacterium]
MELISLFIASLLTENIVLTKFLGLCPFFGNSSRERVAVSMGICVTIITVLSSIITFFIYNFVLVPTGTVYLKTLMFILVIACLVQLLILIIKNKFKTIYKSLGIYLSLITTNCAVMGVVLLGVNNNYNLLETIVYSFGSSLGFFIVIYVFSTIRERLNNVPDSFKGLPIAFITASIMALIFERFIGI